MNVSHLSGGNGWLARLPVAKNSAFLAKSVQSKTAQGGSPADVKLVLHSGEVAQADMRNLSGVPITAYELVPSSQREYTIADALNYQYNKQFTINLKDVLEGKAENIRLRPPGSAVPEEFLHRLQQEGISVKEYDSFWATFYTNGLRTDAASLDHSIDYLASGYTVARQSIESALTGEEKAKALVHLASVFDQTVQKLAQQTAAEIGGFLEQNGVAGETQRIYDSILKAYEQRVEEYAAFSAANSDYAQLEGENAWLMADYSYMACQLRKTAAHKPTQAVEGEYYSLAELQATRELVREIKADSAKISPFGDEEQIGFQLGVIALKGEVYQRFSGASDRLKAAVSKAVESYVNTMTDKLNQQLGQAKKGVAEPWRMADLSVDEVLVVYHKMMTIYRTTGDLLKALQEGAAFASSRHNQKLKDPQYTALNRYGHSGSAFWQNFYSNTLQYKDTLGLLPTGHDGYIDRESGIMALASSWNSFAAKFTDRLHLTSGSFSVYA